MQIDPAVAQSALDRAVSDPSDAKLEARESERAIGLAQDELAAPSARQSVLVRRQALAQAEARTEQARASHARKLQKKIQRESGQIRKSPRNLRVL